MTLREEDDRRHYECLKKYEKIVKQFDELIEMIDARSRPPKRRRMSCGSRGSSPLPAPLMSEQANRADSDEVLVETVTRFLCELNPTPLPDPNTSTSPTLLINQDASP